MKTTATNKKLRELLREMEAKSLIARPEFQRRLVWTNADKTNFIATVLSGYPFPEIYIAAGDVDPSSGDASTYLVDGQQRMTALLHYWKGDGAIRLPKTMKAFKDLEEKN